IPSILLPPPNRSNARGHREIFYRLGVVLGRQNFRNEQRQNFRNSQTALLGHGIGERQARQEAQIHKAGRQMPGISNRKKRRGFGSKVSAPAEPRYPSAGIHG